MASHSVHSSAPPRFPESKTAAALPLFAGTLSWFNQNRLHASFNSTGRRQSILPTATPISPPPLLQSTCTSPNMHPATEQPTQPATATATAAPPSTPRIHRKPPATTCATPASANGSRGIQLGGVIDDGWVYQPPLNLPQSTEDAMGLASEGKLTDVDMVETFRMMSRGQTFTSYVTTINKLDDSARVDRKEIYVFYNKRQHTTRTRHTAQSALT